MIIYKYPLKVVPKQLIVIQEDWLPLSLQIQNDIPILWALIDPANPIENREIIMVGTGTSFNLNDDIIHLGTVQIGRYVWHYFMGEVKR